MKQTKTSFYNKVDAEALLLYYREHIRGRILPESVSSASSHFQPFKIVVDPGLI